MYENRWECGEFNAFAASNPLWDFYWLLQGDKLYGISIGRGCGALYGYSLMLTHSLEDTKNKIEKVE